MKTLISKKNFVNILYSVKENGIIYKLFSREAYSFHLVRRMIAADGLYE